MKSTRRLDPLRKRRYSPTLRPSREDFRPEEWRTIRRFRTPSQVQAFLRTLPYNHETRGPTLRTFRGVLAHGTAHCLEAALAAATILEQHGYRPLLLDIESQDNLDHVVFVFKRRGRWGAVAKSRDSGLHGRKPVFRTLRDLVLSYVDPYVDEKGRITGYGLADLRTLVPGDWRLSDHNVWRVEKALVRMPHRKLKTSDRRYRMIFRRYCTFKKTHPDRFPDFYNGQDRWW